MLGKLLLVIMAVIFSCSSMVSADAYNRKENSLAANYLMRAQIKRLLAEYYQLTPEAKSATVFTYAAADLNDDGQEEILAVVKGPYTSGSGGSSALLMQKTNGMLQVKQDFTLVNTPVMMTDAEQYGYHNLVFPYYGGGQSFVWSQVTYNGKNYANINQGELLADSQSVDWHVLLAEDNPWYQF